MHATPGRCVFWERIAGWLPGTAAMIGVLGGRALELATKQPLRPLSVSVRPLKGPGTLTHRLCLCPALNFRNLQGILPQTRFTPFPGQRALRTANNCESAMALVIFHPMLNSPPSPVKPSQSTLILAQHRISRRAPYASRFGTAIHSLLLPRPDHPSFPSSALLLMCCQHH